MDQPSKSEGCSFCQRRGLPILPVRPAIMSQQDVLPVMPKHIQTPALAQGETAYTLRLLRSGYLNIWDERGNSWINYFVTENGFYYPLPENGEVPEMIQNGTIKPCITEPLELARASLVTLPVFPPPMKNGLFWFSWSEVEWTEAVRKKHEDKAYRERYMQCFDLDKWLMNGQEKQSLSIDLLQDTVAEYSYQAHSNAIKDWSPALWESMHAIKGLSLKQAANHLMAGKGAIVALYDTPAVVQDLAALMNYRLEHNFERHPKYERGLALSASLSMMKDAMCSQYERDRVSEGIRFEKEAREGLAVKNGVMLPSLAATQADTIHNVVNQSLKTQVEQYWAKYEKYIDREKQAAFLEDYNKALSTYDQAVLTPMVTLYLTYFTGQSLLDYFDHNFDQQNIQSGMLFTQSILDCIEGMQDKIAVKRTFQEQFIDSKISEQNLLLRAALFNQQSWIKCVYDAASSGRAYDDLPWDKVWDGFKDISNHYLFQIQLVSEKFFNALSSQLLSVLNKAVNKAPLPILIAISAMNGKKLVPINYIGERKHFLTNAVEQMASMTDLDNKASHSRLRHYLEIEERRERITGLQFEGKQEGRFFAAIDIKEAELSKSTPSLERPQVAVKAFRSAENVKNIAFPKEWRTKLALAKGKTINKLANDTAQSLPFAGCMFSVTLQVHVLWTTTQDAMKGQVNNTEAVTKFIANIISAGGALLDAAERVIFKFRTLRISARIRFNYGRVRLVQVTNFIERGIRFGAWFGAVQVGWDAYHAYDEFEKENSTLGWAYTLSAAGGAALFGASLSPVILAFLGPIGLLIAITLVFGSAIFLNAYKKDEIQEWLSASLWRIIPENEQIQGKIPVIWMDRQMEMSELSKIIGYTEDDA
ncbi:MULTISPECIES: T6SS effector BTH_I2691 family protein [Providencia]|uniref:T6SS effector BTH_I2691 family protein n=1 Tax=Providencia TaxID=586 RepID=UPI0012B553F3|nr:MULTISPECIES: T6SS effector BTH_I2691 family protein [Providencia]MTC55882.1 hypothetical protein [Providencia rustigianii]